MAVGSLFDAVEGDVNRICLKRLPIVGHCLVIVEQALPAVVRLVYGVQGGCDREVVVGAEGAGASVGL